MSQTLRVEHDHLSQESQGCTLKLAPMHVTNWAEAQGEDAVLVTCRKGMRTRKDVGHCWMLDSVGHLQERDAHKKGCCPTKKGRIA